MVYWYLQLNVFQSYFEELERSPKLQLLNDYASQLKTCQPVLTEEVDVFLKEVNTQWSTILTAVQPRNPHQDPLTMVKGETLTLSLTCRVDIKLLTMVKGETLTLTLTSPHHCQRWDIEFNLDFCIWPKTHSTRHIMVMLKPRSLLLTLISQWWPWTLLSMANKSELW